MAETILAQKTALEKKALQLEEAYISMVRVIAASLDARDPYTMGHSTRVARMACALGRRLGMGEEELSNLERSAIFHDIGKIQTPDDVLLKGERLSRADGRNENPIPPTARRSSEGPFLTVTSRLAAPTNGTPRGTRRDHGEEIPLHAH